MKYSRSPVICTGFPPLNGTDFHYIALRKSALSAELVSAG